jgi:peptidoglycan/xylan/chitin deacetylase (PgdA/CDA1 family)
LLKGTLKRRVASTIGRMTAGDANRRVVVLCYHSIHPSLPFASASPELFRRHLEWLTDRCDVVGLSDIGRLAEMQDNLKRPAVALTFDDGYRDNHTQALPLLEAVGAKATFFVTAGLLEQDVDVVARMAALRGVSAREVQGMSWEEARELADAGHEVGSHTWSHPVLAMLDAEAARAELVRSKEVIEERLQQPVTSMAYPFGKPKRHFTGETERVVGEAGYAIAAAVLSRRVRQDDSALRIPRFFATQDSIDVLAGKVFGRWDWLGAWQEHAPSWAARRVSPADFRDLAEDAT